MNKHVCSQDLTSGREKTGSYGKDSNLGIYVCTSFVTRRSEGETRRPAKSKVFERRSAAESHSKLSRVAFRLRFVTAS